MTYPVRTAVTGDPITINFSKLIDLPTIPHSQYFATTPVIFQGANSQLALQPDVKTSDMPSVFIGRDSSKIAAVMGLSHADYALRQATAASVFNNDFPFGFSANLPNPLPTNHPSGDGFHISWSISFHAQDEDGNEATYSFAGNYSTDGTFNDVAGSVTHAPGTVTFAAHYTGAFGITFTSSAPMQTWFINPNSYHLLFSYASGSEFHNTTFVLNVVDLDGEPIGSRTDVDAPARGAYSVGPLYSFDFEAPVGHSAPVEAQAHIDGLYVNLTHASGAPLGLDVDTNVDFTVLRQNLGLYTGGTHANVVANAKETQGITFDDNVQSVYTSFIGAALSSTTAAPKALAVTSVQYKAGSSQPADKFGAILIGASGTLTLKALFRGDIATQPDQGGVSRVKAQCRDAAHHYFVRETGAPTSGLGIDLQYGTAFTICSEQPWGTFDYTNYTPCFDDPELPNFFGTIYWGSSSDYTTRYGASLFRLVAIYGTDQGFLINYKQNIGGTWTAKFILVDRQWTTVRHITPTAGDATATAILAQGPCAGDSCAISMTTDGGYAWMIGGTPTAPLVVEGPLAASTDTTPRQDLHAFTITQDDHDFYVLNLGMASTIVLDKTTGQWSRWKSIAQEYWRASDGVDWKGINVACDSLSGTIWKVDPVGRVDEGYLPIRSEVTGIATVRARKTVPCYSAELAVSEFRPPATSYATSIQLLTSDDNGRTFLDHGSIIGNAAGVNTLFRWYGLGLIQSPGRIFKIINDGYARRIDGLDAEISGG